MMQYRCRACGTQNDVRVRYCHNCGTYHKPRLYAAPGQALTPVTKRIDDSWFCPDCGGFNKTAVCTCCGRKSA